MVSTEKKLKEANALIAVISAQNKTVLDAVRKKVNAKVHRLFVSYIWGWHKRV